MHPAPTRLPQDDARAGNAHVTVALDGPDFRPCGRLQNRPSCRAIRCGGHVYTGGFMVDAASSVAVPDEFAQRATLAGVPRSGGRGELPRVAPRGDPPGCAGCRAGRPSMIWGSIPLWYRLIRGLQAPLRPSHRCLGDFRPDCWSRSLSAVTRRLVRWANEALYLRRPGHWTQLHLDPQHHVRPSQRRMSHAACSRRSFRADHPASHRRDGVHASWPLSSPSPWALDHRHVGTMTLRL